MINNQLVTGFICECNPFHLGHKKIINYIKNHIKSKYIIAIMSGNFVQRGEPAVFDKYERTLQLLENYVDLVIELPIEFTLSSADYFANANIQILNKLNFIDNIVFGSNICDMDYLFSIAKKNIQIEKNKTLYKTYLKNGYTHSKILSEMLNIDLSPNDILAISYIKSIINTKSHITPICFKRDKSIQGASEIRKNLDIKITNNSFSDYLNQILFFNIKNNIDLKKYYCIDDQLSNAIKKISFYNMSFDERVAILYKKNRTKASIKRALLHILFDIENNHIKKLKYGNKFEYIRILGFNKNFNLSNIKIPYLTSINKKGFKNFNKNFDENILFKNENIKNISLLTNIYADDLYFSIKNNNQNESNSKLIIYKNNKI